MVPDAEKVLAEALKLPREERAEIVDRLLRSLDDEEGDALDDADRARLHQAIARSDEQFRRGQGIRAEDALAELERQRNQ